MCFRNIYGVLFRFFLYPVTLKDNFFDLHYAVNANTKPINLGNGKLWRLAVDHPGQKVLPRIHRAPK